MKKYSIKRTVVLGTDWLIDVRLKSIKNGLCKADISIKWTVFFGTKVCALERFYCMSDLIMFVFFSNQIAFGLY